MNLQRNGLELDDLDAVQHWADKIKEELNRNRFRIDLDDLAKFWCMEGYVAIYVINLCTGVN